MGLFATSSKRRPMLVKCSLCGRSGWTAVLNTAPAGWRVFVGPLGQRAYRCGRCGALPAGWR